MTATGVHYWRDIVTKKDSAAPSTGLKRALRGSTDANAMPRDQRERLKRQAALDVDILIRAHGEDGDSWRKRGGGEAYHNLTRKWDRIERAIEALPEQDIFAAIRQHTATDGTLAGKDSLLDDIGDLRRYLHLVEEYVMRVAL